MAAARHNITIEQGANLKLDFVYREPNQGTNADGSVILGDPINITGATFEMQIRLEEETVAFLKDYSAYFAIVVALNGSFELNVPHAQTLDYDTESAVYDIFMTIGAERLKLLEGKVKRSRDVSR